MVIWDWEAQKTQQKPTGMKNWNEPRMPKEMKWAKETWKQ